MKHRGAQRLRVRMATAVGMLALASTTGLSVGAAATDAPATASPGWPQLSFGPARNADNFGERVLSPANVGTLHKIWSATGVENGVIPSMVAGNGLLYVCYASSTPASQAGVHALNLTTGATVWSYAFPAGCRYVPALSGQTVYMSTGIGLVALNALTGAVRWRSSAGGNLQAVASPLVADGTVYLVSFVTSAILRAVNGTTGATLWTVPIASSLTGPLSYRNGVVYATTALGYGATSLVVAALNATNGTAVWSTTLNDKSAWYRPIVTVGPDLAFVNGHKGVWALHLTDGSIAWHAVFPGGGTGSGTLALDTRNDTLISPEFSGQAAWRASTGVPLWSIPATWNSPAVANGVVYTSAGVVRETTGGQLWPHPSGFQADDIDGVVVTGGHLYVHGSFSGLSFDVYSFGIH